MRIRLFFFLLFATAASAFAQFPVKTTVQYPSVLPAAEIHFNDGNIEHYPIKRISKDLIRVDTGNDQSIRMPLTYVNSIHFKDGCTIYFDQGEFQFDKLVQPARLKSDSGEALLEGVLKLSKSQAASLMGPELYGEFQKNSRLLQVSLGTMMTGFVMVLPYTGQCIAGLGHGNSPGDVFKSFSTSMKCTTIGGAGVLVAGIVMSYIANNGCKRVVATYNDGLGLAYTF